MARISSPLSLSRLLHIFMATFLSPIDQNEEEKERQLTENESEQSYERNKELFLSLPKEKGWIFDFMYLYQGFWYHLRNGLGVMAVQQYFKPRKTDILLISTPKSGTIWLKAILFAIMNRTRYTISNHPILTNNPHDLVPFLEMQVFAKPPFPNIENLPSPRLFSTHIPFGSLSDSIINSDCKIVYICRNPKDVVVSKWKFMSKLREENLPPFTLQEAYDLFSKGASEYGPFWDHVEGYKKASLEWPKRVIFITYEAMKMEPMANIKRLAEFLGRPFTVEEESDGLVEEILKLCSFGNLRNLEVNNGKCSFGKGTNEVFFRKGKVGDWKNHLTTQMIENLDEITNNKLNDLFPPPLGSNR